MARSAHGYVLPQDATVHSSNVIHLGDGEWLAGFTVSVPGQGGYDCADTDDIMRHFSGPTAEQDARTWLVRKLNHEV